MDKVYNHSNAHTCLHSSIFEENMENLKPILNRIREFWGTPGLAAALIDHDQTFTYCLGVLSLENQGTVTPRHDLLPGFSFQDLHDRRRDAAG